MEVLEDRGNVVGAVWVSRRAAEFWMYWSLFKVLDGEPYRMLLQ